MIYALIKDGIVKNRIVADSDFIALIADKWDFCIQVSGMDPEPQIGWLYDGSTFSEPTP